MPSPLVVAVSKIETVAADENQDVSQANQDAITVNSKGNGVYEVVADVDGLNKFTSTNPAQGDGKWIGLVVNTGEQDITKVKYDGNAFTVADVAEAASIGVPAGSFVLWLDAEDLEIEDRTIVLSTDNKADTTILIKLA